MWVNMVPYLTLSKDIHRGKGQLRCQRQQNNTLELPDQRVHMLFPNPSQARGRNTDESQYGAGYHKQCVC